MKIFVVVPTLNESKTIGRIVAELKPYSDAVVVVDGNSSDNTVELAENAGAVVLRHIINRYQGAALRTGTYYAIENSESDNDIIVHFDADGQMRAVDVPKVIEPIKQGLADVAFGSRFLDNSTKMPFLKKYIIMPVAKVINRSMGIKLTDPQSGFRTFTVGVARQLDFQQDGYAHCSEILTQVHKKKFRIVEVPITVIYNRFGLSFGGGFRIIKDILIAKLIK